jgi:U3 small nucleolar ribonucleoprotein protein LCP5
MGGRGKNKGGFNKTQRLTRKIRKSENGKRRYDEDEEDFEEMESHGSLMSQENKSPIRNEESAEEISEENSDSEAELNIITDDIDKDNKIEVEEDLSYEPTKQEKKEFNQSLNQLLSHSQEVNKSLSSLLTNIQEGKVETKYGLTYLDAKNQLFLSYLINLQQYTIMKAKGESGISNKQAIKDLIYLKTILEKSKVIDLKLKTQVDRLLKLSEKDENMNDGNIEIEEGDFRPKILEQEEDEEEVEALQEKKLDDKKKMKYAVNKRMNEFFETKNENKQRINKIEKMKEKNKNSEAYRALRSEFSEMPEEINGAYTEYDKARQAMEEYEDDHFINIKISKKDKKKMNKMQIQDNDFTNIGKEFKNLGSILNHEAEEEVEREKKFLGSKRAFSGNNRNQTPNKRNGNFSQNSKKNKIFKRKY